MGVMTLMLVYLLVIARCMFIALNAQSMFGRLMAGTIGLTFLCLYFCQYGYGLGHLCRWLAHRCHLSVMAAQQL